MDTITGTATDSVNLEDLNWWTKPAEERDAVFAHLQRLLGSFIAMDNPEHARLRKIVSRGFTAKNVDLLSSTNPCTAAGALP